MLNSPLPAWNLQCPLHLEGQGVTCHPHQLTAPGVLPSPVPGGAHRSSHSFTAIHLISGGSEDAFLRALLHQNEIYLFTGMQISKEIISSAWQLPPSSPSISFLSFVPQHWQILTSTSISSHRQLLPGSLGIKQHFTTILQPLHTNNLEITLPGVTK